MPSQDRKDELAKRLMEIGALRLGDFILSSGKRSAYYLDLRLVPSHPDVFWEVLQVYREMACEVGVDKFDAIAGVATAGVVLSSPLAVFLRKPMVYVRREEKGHGLRRVVEGDVERGSRVVIVDDLITTGESIAETAEILRSEGCVVSDGLVLVDRLEGGRAKLAGLGVMLRSFFTIEEIALSLLKLGLLSEERADVIFSSLRQRQGGRKIES